VHGQLFFMLNLFLFLCAVSEQESPRLSVSKLFHMFDGDALFPEDWNEVQSQADIQPSSTVKLGQTPAGSLQYSADGKQSSSGFGNQCMQLGSVSGGTSSSLQNFTSPVPKIKPAPSPGLDISVLQNQIIIGERFQLTQPLPWETGFAGRVLGYEDMFKWPHSAAPFRTQVLADELKAQSSGSPHDLLIVRKSTVPKLAYTKVRFAKQVPSNDALRDRAITKWRLILESDLEATESGLQVLVMVQSIATDSELVEMLHNIFAGKKTPTLVKRAESILRYLSWCRGRAIDRPLLFQETVVYNFVLYLLKAGGSASSAKSFREALVFLRHLLGSAAADPCLSSTRIKGCCIRLAQQKRPLKQSNTLKWRQLQALEALTINAPSDPDRCAAGFFTFCTLSSSRNFDANNSETCEIEPDDEGNWYIELGTLKHKTAQTPAKQTTFLPLVAFSPAFIRTESTHWAEAWIRARENCNLSFGPNKPVLPALGVDGKFLSRPATSGECTEWLCELLVMAGVYEARITTHGLKATVLSWAASYGMSLEDRRVLGHHSHPTVKSILTYSRQALIGPLSNVYCMITEIIDGTFDPNAPRIRMIIQGDPTSRKKNKLNTSADPNSVAPWPEIIQGESIDEDSKEQYQDAAGEPTATEVLQASEPLQPPKPVEPEVISDSDTSSSSDSSDLDADDIPDSRFDDDAIEAIGLEPKVQEHHIAGFETFQHNKSGTVHYRDPCFASRLLCNRIYTSVYSKIKGQLKYQWPVCSQCIARTQRP
jgi:hypothetical protein